MWLWALTGCWTMDQDVVPVGPDPEQVALDEANTLADEAAKTLQTQMIQQMGNPGPDGVIVAGSTEADVLSAHNIGAPDPGANHLGRTSSRLRDPANKAPGWVQAWLEEHEGKEFSDVTGIARIEATPTGSVARVIRPIPMLDSCVRCHGPAESIPADVRTRLEERYPLDEALGYEVGDLRGALWVEVAVASPGDG